MPSCKHCGKHESSDWNLAGYVCSGCRHSCPNCGESGKGFPATTFNTVKYNGDKMFWCAGCGQLIPPSFMELDTPVNDDDFPSDLVGVTTTDADGAPDDAEGVVDVPTYDAP